jgi:hypothetical protein
VALIGIGERKLNVVLASFFFLQLATYELCKRAFLRQTSLGGQAQLLLLVCLSSFASRMLAYAKHEDLPGPKLHFLISGFCCREYDGIILDYSRQKATTDTMKKLFKLAEVSSTSPLYRISPSTLSWNSPSAFLKEGVRLASSTKVL